MGTVRLRRRYLQALADILKDRPGIEMKEAKREAIRIARRTHGSVCKEHSAPSGHVEPIHFDGMCLVCGRRRVQLGYEPRLKRRDLDERRCRRCIELGRKIPVTGQQAREAS